ncbi:hypothetical protein FBU30_009067 [Linnemannia zychae]|nr:hypothetical protein FBU30_009067 [Linnemannia zychae]
MEPNNESVYNGRPQDRRPPPGGWKLDAPRIVHSIVHVEPQGELFHLESFSNKYHSLIQTQKDSDPYDAFITENKNFEQEMAERFDTWDETELVNDIFGDPTVLGLLQEWHEGRLAAAHKGPKDDQELRPSWSSFFGKVDEVTEFGDQSNLHLKGRSMPHLGRPMASGDDNVRRLLSSSDRGRRRIPFVSGRQNARPKNLTKVGDEGKENVAKRQKLSVQQGSYENHDGSKISGSAPLNTAPAVVTSGSTANTAAASVESTSTNNNINSSGSLSAPLLDPPSDMSIEEYTQLQKDVHLIEKLADRRAQQEVEKRITKTSLETKFQRCSLMLEDSDLKSLDLTSQILLPVNQRPPLNLLPVPPHRFSRPFDPIMENDLIVSIAIYNPYRPDRRMEEFLFLGSQRLSALRDAFNCASDTAISEWDELEERTQCQNSADKKTSNSFFFIEGTFYSDSPLLRARLEKREKLREESNGLLEELEKQRQERYQEAVKSRNQKRHELRKDLMLDGMESDEDNLDDDDDMDLDFDDSDLRAKMEECTYYERTLDNIPVENQDLLEKISEDYSQNILDWISESPERKRQQGFLNLKKKYMHDVLIQELSIRLNHPYLFVHQGNCEHIIMFRDLRLFSQRHDDLNRLSYPLQVYKEKTTKHMCRMCKINKAFYRLGAMRRMRPQRSELTISPKKNNSAKPTLGDANLKYESKAWTTHSDLHKQYLANNNTNNTLDQAIIQAKHTSTTTSAKRPFIFNVSSIAHHGHEQEPNATKTDHANNFYGKNAKNSKKNNSKDRDTKRDKTSVSRSTSDVMVEDDCGDDFELPEVDDLFADALPRKTSQVKGSSEEIGTHSHQTGKSSLTKGPMLLQSPSRLDMNMDTNVDKYYQNQVELATAHDKDILRDTYSNQNVGEKPVYENKHSNHKQQQNRISRNQPYPAISTRPTLSQAQCTLNEIDMLFGDDLPIPSSSSRFKSPDEGYQKCEIGSPIPHAAVSDQSPSCAMNESDNDIVVSFGLQDGDIDRDSVIWEDEHDITSGVTEDDCAESRKQKIPSVNSQDRQNTLTLGNQASDAVSHETEVPQQTLTFTLPGSFTDFHDRLKCTPSSQDYLSSDFQSLLDEMMCIIKDVEQLRASVDKSLADQQDLIYQRGEHIHQQVRQLQEDASALHTKAQHNSSTMDHSDSHDDALADRILKYATSTSKTSDLPPFPGDDVESLPSDYEYQEGDDEEYEEEIEEISEMELLGHLDASMPPLLLAQELFNSNVDCSAFNVLTADNANELFHKGYITLDNVLPLSTIQSVRQWAIEMFKSGKMDKASGKHNEEDDPFREGNARGDYTIWVSPGSKFLEVSPALKECVDWFSGRLHEDLAKIVHLHGQAEYQLAYYPPDSSHYERHRDSFPTDDKEDIDQRRITAIVYFNPDWKQGDGGELRIFDKGMGDVEEKKIDIAPLAARCVVFLSGVMDHAVMPAFEERIALTSWYR